MNRPAIQVNPDFGSAIESNYQQQVETLAAHICSFTGYSRGKLLERLAEHICMGCGADTTRAPCYCQRDD